MPRGCVAGPESVDHMGMSSQGFIAKSCTREAPNFEQSRYVYVDASQGVAPDHGHEDPAPFSGYDRLCQSDILLTHGYYELNHSQRSIRRSNGVRGPCLNSSVASIMKKGKGGGEDEERLESRNPA